MSPTTPILGTHIPEVDATCKLIKNGTEVMIMPSPHKEKTHRLSKEGEHPWGDVGQFVLLIVFLAAWALDSFILRFSTVLAPLVPLGVRLAAAGLVFLAALRLAHKGHVVISGEVIRQGRLVRDGVFARVRHPLYLAALLFYASLSLSTLSLIAAALLAGIFGFYDFIASYEERILLGRHGDEFREYRRRVPKWIPRLRAARSD